MREFDVENKLSKTLAKLAKRDAQKYRTVMRKMQEILTCSNPDHYKNLRYDLKNMKRVHIGQFVLVFCYDELNDKIIFEDYDHHDNIYKQQDL